MVMARLRSLKAAVMKIAKTLADKRGVGYDLRAGEYGAQLVECSGVAGDRGGGVFGVKTTVDEAYEPLGWHR